MKNDILRKKDLFQKSSQRHAMYYPNGRTNLGVIAIIIGTNKMVEMPS